MDRDPGLRQWESLFHQSKLLPGESPLSAAASLGFVWFVRPPSPLATDASGHWCLWITATESAARRRDDVIGMRLYVERENDRARTAYERLGMSRTRYELFEVDWSGTGDRD